MNIKTSCNKFAGELQRLCKNAQHLQVNCKNITYSLHYCRTTANMQPINTLLAVYLQKPRKDTKSMQVNC